MLYNNANPYDRGRFLDKARRLAEEGKIVELTEKAQRTISQNSYLHLLIGIVATVVGTTLEDAKETYYKRIANPSIFVRKRFDKVLKIERDYLRSSSRLNKDEMSESISRFKIWASQNGIYLPEPDERDALASAEVEINKYQQFL